MKWLAYSMTILLVGALTVTAVRFPAVQKVLSLSNTYVSCDNRHFLDFQNRLKLIKPLVIDKDIPTLQISALDNIELNELIDISISSEFTSLPPNVNYEKINKEDSAEKIRSSDFDSFFDSESFNENIVNKDEFRILDEKFFELNIPRINNDGYILLDIVMEKHPLWVELVNIDREIETLKGQWRKYVDASVNTEEDMLKCLDTAEQILGKKIIKEENNHQELDDYLDKQESRLVLMETSLLEETEMRIKAKESELKTDLDDRLYAKKVHLNNKFDDFRDKVIKKSYVTIVDIQMKLRLLGLSESEKASLEEKLRCLSDEIQVELDEKQKILDDIYKEYETKETQKIKEKLAEYKKEQFLLVASHLEEERNKVAEESKRLFPNTLQLGTNNESGIIQLSARHEEMLKEFKAKETEFIKELDRLALNKNKVRDLILQDIETLISDFQDKLNINIKIVSNDFGVKKLKSQRIDMTSDIIRIIRNYEQM